MTLPLSCTSLIQSFLVLQFATCGTTITAAATITAKITGTGSYVAAVVNGVVVIAVVVTVVRSAVVTACIAIAATTAAATTTVTVYIHAAANAPDILSSILTGPAYHPAFSLLLHTRRCTIHTLRLPTNHASTVHTTTLTRLKQHIHIIKTNLITQRLSEWGNQKRHVPAFI